MKNDIEIYLKDLNAVGVNSSVLIFRNCFSFLSYSFESLTIEQLDDLIKQLENSNLEMLWGRQKEMKYPRFILYFAMWHFRDKILHEKEYSRWSSEKLKALSRDYQGENEITNKINRDIDALNVFEAVEFLGSLIGVWMLTYPKEKILETSSLPNSEPNEIWLKSVFSDTVRSELSGDDLRLLYRLDYYLYLAFEDVEAHNTF
jgi:hypothetical protein